MTNQGDRERQQQYRQLGIAVTIPFLILAAPAVGYGIGLLLDGWLGTTPFLSRVFLLLGLVAGILETVELIRKLR